MFFSGIDCNLSIIKPAKVSYLPSGISIFISSLISLIDILASTINCSFETLTILLLLLPFSSILSPTIFSKHLDNVNNPEISPNSSIASVILLPVF